MDKFDAFKMKFAIFRKRLIDLTLIVILTLRNYEDIIENERTFYV